MVRTCPIQEKGCLLSQQTAFFSSMSNFHDLPHTQIYANLNMKKTGENIRSRRERLGMNRPDIQKKMGLAGVQSVWNWEKGKKMPNIENLFALAEILHTTVDDLCVREIVEV